MVPVRVRPLAGRRRSRFVLLPPVDARLAFPLPAQREDLVVAGVPRRRDRGHIHQFPEPRFHPRLQRGVGHHEAGVLVLGVEEGAGLRALLVLEPAVGVGDLDAVEGVGDHLDPRFGGRGPRRRRAPGGQRRGKHSPDGRRTGRPGRKNGEMAHGWILPSAPRGGRSSVPGASGFGSPWMKQGGRRDRRGARLARRESGGVSERIPTDSQRRAKRSAGMSSPVRCRITPSTGC